MTLPNFVNLFDTERTLSDPKPGQKVILASFNGRVLWDLDSARFYETEITAVKRKYIYVGTGRNPDAFDKETLIERRTDGYSPDKAIFPSMDAIEAARAYLTLVGKLSKLSERLKQASTMAGDLPSLSALQRAEAALTELLEPGQATTTGSDSESDTAAIFDIIENAVSIAGYTVLDGDRDTVYIRKKETDQDYEIKVQPTAG